MELIDIEIMKRETRIIRWESKQCYRPPQPRQRRKVNKQRKIKLWLVSRKAKKSQETLPKGETTSKQLESPSIGKLTNHPKRTHKTHRPHNNNNNDRKKKRRTSGS